MSLTSLLKNSVYTHSGSSEISKTKLQPLGFGKTGEKIKNSFCFRIHQKKGRADMFLYFSFPIDIDD